MSGSTRPSGSFASTFMSLHSQCACGVMPISSMSRGTMAESTTAVSSPGGRSILRAPSTKFENAFCGRSVKVSPRAERSVSALPDGW
jgi:hypothetical protein